MRRRYIVAFDGYAMTGTLRFFRRARAIAQAAEFKELGYAAVVLRVPRRGRVLHIIHNPSVDNAAAVDHAWLRRILRRR